MGAAAHHGYRAGHARHLPRAARVYAMAESRADHPASHSHAACQHQDGPHPDPVPDGNQARTESLPVIGPAAAGQHLKYRPGTTEPDWRITHGRRTDRSDRSRHRLTDRAGERAAGDQPAPAETARELPLGCIGRPRQRMAVSFKAGARAAAYGRLLGGRR